MRLGTTTPDRAAFEARDAPVVAVTRRLLADGETPVGVYRKLAGGPGTFLLESAEHGASWSRWSFVGVRSAATLSVVGGEVEERGAVGGDDARGHGDPAVTACPAWWRRRRTTDATARAG